MITEKETIARILRGRGILKRDGTIDMVRFQKLVTEPWIHQKAKQYGFLDGTAANEVVEVPVAPTTVEINETPAEQEVNLTELPAEEVKGGEMIHEEINETPAERPEPVEDANEEVPVEQPASENKEEDKVEDEKPAEEAKEEEVPVPAADPEPVEDPAPEVPVVEKKTTKRTSKK